MWDPEPHNSCLLFSGSWQLRLFFPRTQAGWAVKLPACPGWQVLLLLPTCKPSADPQHLRHLPRSSSQRRSLTRGIYFKLLLPLPEVAPGQEHSWFIQQFVNSLLIVLFCFLCSDLPPSSWKSMFAALHFLLPCSLLDNSIKFFAWLDLRKLCTIYITKPSIPLHVICSWMNSASSQCWNFSSMHSGTSIALLIDSWRQDGQETNCFDWEGRELWGSQHSPGLACSWSTKLQALGKILSSKRGNSQVQQVSKYDSISKKHVLWRGKTTRREKMKQIH